MPSPEPSPRPWRVERSAIGSNAWIVSGEVFVASASSASDAALIVAAVNERDLLRGIVRRIETEMERCHRRDGEISQELMTAVYEAGAIIGEGAR